MFDGNSSHKQYIVYSVTKKKMSGENRVVFCANKNAFKSRVSSYTLKNIHHIDLTEFFNDAFPLFASETKKLLDEFSILKLNSCFEAKFTKPVTKISDN